MKKRLGSLVLFLAIGSFVSFQDSVASSAVTQTGTAAEEDNQETESPKQVLRQRTVEHTLHIGKIDFFGYGNLSPAKIREVKGNEGSESGLDIGQEKIHPVQPLPALPRDGRALGFAGPAIARERSVKPA